MSLIVCASNELADGTSIDLEPTPPHNDLAGFESTRVSFYASERARRLGLVLLPSLAYTDIHARGDDLVTLEKEVRLLMGSLELDDDRDYWLFRLENILEAIRLANSVSAGRGVVYIG